MTWTAFLSDHRGQVLQERPEIRDGRMWVPDRPGLGFTLTQRMRDLTKETASIGRP